MNAIKAAGYSPEAAQQSESMVGACAGFESGFGN
jgi:hypothetical protein